MRPSRVVFAIADLAEEIRQLSPQRGSDGAPLMTAAEIHMDEKTFAAVIGEIANHYGAVAAPNDHIDFCGMRLVMAREKANA